MISLRTLGTSLKKKSAKIPATAPKDPAVIPLRFISRMFSGAKRGYAVQFHGAADADAVEVGLGFVAGGRVLV